MTKRMICYRRVSTDDQADHGYSLPSQQEAILQYAESHDFTIGADFAEDYSGATPLGERPEGKKVVAMLRRKEADGVIVHQVDRLSRDIVDALTVVRDVTRAGLEIHACDMGRIGSETDITLVVKAWQGHDERKKIIERTTRGKNGKAKSGQVVGTGKPPYGYRIVHERVNSTGKITHSRFEIEESQAQIVRMIYQWYTTEGMGAFTIAKRLTLAREVPPGQRNQSGEWNLVQVRHILSNETYTGVWHYGKQIGRNGKGGKRDMADQFAVPVPAIVSRKVWQAAQEQRDHNVQTSKRNCKNEYLLRGMVKCACGCTLIGLSVPERNWYGYRCSSHIRRLVVTDQTCRQSSINGKVIDAKVWDWILGVITDPAGLEDKLRQAQAAALAALQPKRDELDHVEALIAQADAELDDNLAMMKGLDDHSIRHEKLMAEGDRIEARMRELKKRQAVLEADIHARVITDEEITDLCQFRSDAELGLNNPTFEEKRRWLERMKTHVEVSGHTGVVTCYLPVEAGVIDLSISSGDLPKQPRYIVLTSPPIDLSAEFFKAAARKDHLVSIVN